MRLPRLSGVLLHPTSLPGPHGSGDLGPDARHFIDWLQAAGQSLWQILPLGGIGPGNSPYMSSSAFAGNLLLIDLDELRRHGWLSEADVAPDAGLQSQRIDFGTLVPYRMARLAKAARRFAAAPGTHATAFDRFRTEHASWLADYALFMSLWEHHGFIDWTDWPAPLARRDEAAMAQARQQHAERIGFYEFCQWSFFRQWKALRAYANERGVQIMGDAPIFIAHQSAEVWARQELFELDDGGRPTAVAGVPPDFFSATGQRWGNPLYRWSAHAAEGYAWWTERIRRIFEMTDLVRIDHFRGFAGYWEIPADEPTAINGQWKPGPGAALFEAVAAALGPLPIVAEDLGVITPDVVALRQRFKFPGMLILQFAFGGGSDNTYLPHNHTADSVVYTGTHDNNTTLGWWAEAGEAERHHARSYLATDGAHILPAMLRTAAASVADTAIFPMQDVLGLGAEARMNVPGVGDGAWAWRFDWRQVRPEHGQALHELCRQYGRLRSSPQPKR